MRSDDGRYTGLTAARPSKAASVILISSLLAEVPHAHQPREPHPGKRLCQGPHRRTSSAQPGTDRIDMCRPPALEATTQSQQKPQSLDQCSTSPLVRSSAMCTTRSQRTRRYFPRSPPHAEALIEWKADPNTVRPHSSLGKLPPATFAILVSPGRKSRMTCCCATPMMRRPRAVKNRRGDTFHNQHEERESWH
jgi:hypothetical protein